MGKSSGGGGSQTTTQKVEYPAWVDAAAQKNLDLADQLATKPYTGYAGQLLANIDPYTKNAQTALLNLANTNNYDVPLNAATNQLVSDIGYTPTSLSANTVGRSAVRELDPTMLNKRTADLMNPYTNTVIDNTIKDMDKSRIQALQLTGDKAIAANAFGGDRHGLMEAQVNKDFVDSVGNMSANLRNSQYNNAMNAALASGQYDAGQDAQIALANQKAAQDTAQFNQTTGLDAMKARLAGTSMLPSAVSAERQNQIADASILENVGAFNQNRSQQELDLAYSKYLEEQNYPRDMLNLRVQALGGTPYGSTTTGIQPTQGSNPIAGAMGGAMMGASLGSMMAPAGATGLAAVGGLPFLLGGAALGLLS
jgi:hypothetical protein